MKYTLLQGWIREPQPTGWKVDNICFRDNCVHIRFGKDTELVLVLTARDAYPFWHPNSGPEPGDKPLWPQLKHAQLARIGIADNDRIVSFGFELTDIYQQRQDYVLIAEFIPPRPNLILALRDRDLTIVDALEKYSYADNPQRQILPRLPYQAPQTSFVPDKTELSLPLTLQAKGETASCPTFNSYLQTHFDRVLRAREDEERRAQTRARWERELKKTAQKLARQEAELAQADQLEHWRICAETIKQHLPELRTGQTVLSAVNYFDPQLNTIEIPLETDKTPRQNLQIYLKLYQKAKRGREIIAANIEQTRRSLRHLQNILERIDAGGMVAPPSAQNLAGLGHKLDSLDKLLKLRLNDDFELVIGRKARENDFITTQLAQPHDWWFHTRIYHGSHIVLRCLRKSAPDEALIALCCSLAAWYSKARWSANVPVDYTQIRYVRKPRKSAPGFVTYTNHRTYFAQPRDLRSIRAEMDL